MNTQKTKLWVPVAVAAVVFGLAVWLMPGLLRQFKARHDVRELAAGLAIFESENGRYPTGTTAEVCALLRGENVNNQNPNRRDYVEAKMHEMNAAGEFVDPWGTSYRILTSPKPWAYSCGPNKLDEQGRGDDIASR
jgi:hypothetical protein